MSWAKIDDRANEHEKQLAAGPRACWLWACGLMYCNRQTKKTGLIPKTVVHGSMLFPGLGKKEATDLVRVGLWHEDGEHYVVHEFHGWNPELSAKRSEAGRVGGLRSGESRREANEQAPPEANGEANAKQVASENEANDEAMDSLAHSRARTRAQPRAGSTPPHPTPGEEDPPTPLPKPRDRFAESFVAPTRNRPDVLELFELWKSTFGFRDAQLGLGIYNLDAETLAAAIDALDLETCKLVLKHAPSDGMVSGRDDERKTKHESVAYIFGNQNTLNRILRAAREAERNQGCGGSAVDDIRKRKEARL